MNDKPSQAFLDSEIGHALSEIIAVGYMQGITPESYAVIQNKIARIERLLAAERRKVAEECIRLTREAPIDVLGSEIDNLVDDIRARFPAPKEDA